MFLTNINAQTLENAFTEQDHCVAWKTNKKMFLFKSSQPVGKSCKVQFQSLNNGQDWQIKIPLDSFDSGEKDRDLEVVKILKGDLQPQLVLKTVVNNIDMLAALWTSNEVSSIPVELLIGGQSHKINISIHSPRVGVLNASWKGTFSQLKIDAPKVAGGLVAKVSDDLELWAQLQKNQMVSDK